VLPNLQSHEEIWFPEVFLSLGCMKEGKLQLYIMFRVSGQETGDRIPWTSIVE
jgi:hypothetical protein